MAARSIRWPAACCRSPWARRPRPCPSSWTAGRNTASRSASGKRARRRMPRARSPPPATFVPPTTAIRSALAAFVGDIEQVPPAFSALKIEGKRAYDLARAGEPVDLKPRRVLIERLELLGRPDTDHADFVVSCGKGTYIRSLGRDLALRSGDRRIPVGAASDGRRAVPRRGGHFASQTGGPRAYSRASRGPGPRRDRAGRHPGAGPDGGPSGPAAPRPAGALDPGRTAVRRPFTRRDRQQAGGAGPFGRRLSSSRCASSTFK